eukprot:6211480-Pleurochrysis_carterae.AAC.1
MVGSVAPRTGAKGPRADRWDDGAFCTLCARILLSSPPFPCGMSSCNVVVGPAPGNLASPRRSLSSSNAAFSACFRGLFSAHRSIRTPPHLRLYPPCAAPFSCTLHATSASAWAASPCMRRCRLSGAADALSCVAAQVSTNFGHVAWDEAFPLLVAMAQLGACSPQRP